MFDQFMLDNGVTIIGERIPHFRSVSIGLWVASGSQYEQPAENGVSHFIEHMLFKGTQRRSARDIAEEMDAVGGALNAFTSKECTCFYAKTVDQDLPLAMDILADIFLHSRLDEADIEREKGVVLEEIAMAEDTPEDAVHELIMLAQYGDQPLARPILGSEETVRAFTRDSILRYYHRLYRPKDTVLALAGNYDWEQVKALAAGHLGGFQAVGEGRGDFATHSVAPTALFREKDTEQLHLCLGYPMASMGSDELYPTAIFNSVLGGAMSSHLFQSIREERGLAYSVYSYPNSYTDCGMLTVYAGTNPESAREVVRLIREEVRAMAENGLSEQEFRQALAQLKASYILGQESTSNRMNALGRRKLLLGNEQTEEDALRKIDAVTREETNAIMKRVLSSPCSYAFVGKGAQKLGEEME